MIISYEYRNRKYFWPIKDLIVFFKSSKKIHNMKLSKLPTVALLFASACFFTFSCKEGVKKDEEPIDVQELAKDKPEVHGTEVKEGEIQFTNPLNAEWVSSGKAIYELKCQSCHKLTEEKLVGPGWKNVTKRR